MNPADQPTLDDYNRLQQANTRIEGFGLGNVTCHTPCPFCCAPDFRSYKIEDAQVDGAKNAVCKACGRGSRFIFTAVPSGTQIEWVQTSGDDPAPYLPKPRRVEEPIVPPYPEGLHS